MILITSMTLVGVTVQPSAADQHTFNEAPDKTEAGNFTIAARSPSDHYPGNMNEENGSIEYHADLGTALEELGAENGVWADTIIISADWIDYSSCSVDNTLVFGLDRGANNSGIKTDEDLVEHQRRTNFRDDGLTIYFYNWEDLGGDTPFIDAGDEIVSAQGEGSAGGSCLTYTSEPGWYQMEGFLNGTAADGDCAEEGNPDCQPPEDREPKGGYMQTLPYFYICECESEDEAREKLGPPPNEQDNDGEDTSTATPTATASNDGETPTITSTATASNDGETPTITPTATASNDGETPTITPTATASNDEKTQANAVETADDSGGQTPTPGDGPGFGPLVAIIALLAATLLVRQRR